MMLIVHNKTINTIIHFFVLIINQHTFTAIFRHLYGTILSLKQLQYDPIQNIFRHIFGMFIMEPLPWTLNIILPDIFILITQTLRRYTFYLLFLVPANTYNTVRKQYFLLCHYYLLSVNDRKST